MQNTGERCTNLSLILVGKTTQDILSKSQRILWANNVTLASVVRCMHNLSQCICCSAGFSQSGPFFLQQHTQTTTTAGLTTENQQQLLGIHRVALSWAQLAACSLHHHGSLSLIRSKINKTLSRLEASRDNISLPAENLLFCFNLHPSNLYTFVQL